MDKDNYQRVVVCAANRTKSGKMICGARHWDNVMRGQVCNTNWLSIKLFGRLPKCWRGAEQGFIDQFGVFMDRQEAWKVAEAAGQIKYGREHSKGTLYSEDLY
jgi:hypothetical protein